MRRLPRRPPPQISHFFPSPSPCRFIKQEAEEKAAEIAVAAEEEFNITRLQLLEAEKARVRREFERREGTIEVKKKV
jgi:V-type H+-transporting ATPase subunit E